MTNETGHFFMYLLALPISSLVKCPNAPYQNCGLCYLCYIVMHVRALLACLKGLGEVIVLRLLHQESLLSFEKVVGGGSGCYLELRTTTAISYFQ